MTDRKWHKGPPPHVGWWNASLGIDKTVWRWWDGSQWSYGAYPTCSVTQAARAADCKLDTAIAAIKWTHYYPENARVPRIDPRKAK